MKRPRMGPEKQAPRAICLLMDRPWVIVAGCLAALAAAALFLVLTLPRGSVDDLLRAIDATHVVPAEENAARIYTELSWDPTLPSLDSSFLPPQVLSATISRPWRSAEFPQVARWLDERQAILMVLLKAAGKPRCWFSVSEALWQAGRRGGTGGEWPNLLLQAANRDLGEGRVEAGLEKLLCLFRMAQHFLSQSSPTDYGLGQDMASTGLRRFARLVITEEVPPEWLARLESALPPRDYTLMERSRQVEEVRALYEQETKRSLLQRLKDIFFPRTRSSGIRLSDLDFLDQCRAARILLALRRYRNDTGRWPADLRELVTHLSLEAPDLFSGTRFVYRLQGDGFVLYNVGLNGTDEGGQLPGDSSCWPLP